MENTKEVDKKELKKKSTNIGCLAIAVIVILIAVIASIGGNDGKSAVDKGDASTNKDTTQSNNKVANTTPEQPASSGLAESQKAAILEFEKQIYATEKIASRAIEAYTTKASDMGKGKASIYDVYSAASTAKDKCKEVQFAMNKIKTPDVPKEIKKLLDDTKLEIGTAYMVKAEALDSAMKFLDNQKPSDMQNFKDKIKSSDSFTMGAVLKLYQAKERAGIKVEEK